MNLFNWLRKAREPLIDRELPLTEHLAELRDRLLYSALAICAFAAIGFVYAREIINFMMYPLKRAMDGLPIPPQLHFTSITEPLFQSFKIALFTGIALAFPFWIWQTWKFVAPGLYQNERKLVSPFLLSSSALFLIGATFAYTIAVPMAYRFLLLYANPYLEAPPKKLPAALSIEFVPTPSSTVLLKKTKVPKRDSNTPVPYSTTRSTPPPKVAQPPATPGIEIRWSIAPRSPKAPDTPRKWKLQISTPTPMQALTPDSLWGELSRHKKLSFLLQEGHHSQRYNVLFHWPKKTPAASATDMLKPILTLQAYLSVSSWFLLGFGLIFQTPLVILLITASGLISSQTFREYRRHAFVVILIIAAILTPTGDPLNLMIMAIPMYILFELGLWVSDLLPLQKIFTRVEDEQSEHPDGSA